MKWHFWLHPLRGMAAVFVVLLHSYWTWSFYDHGIVRKFYLMVDFFFVLSGFVISSGYFSRIVDFASVMSFFRKRIDRLHFQYLLSGGAWFAAAMLFGLYQGVGEVILSILRYLFFLDFLFNDRVPRINPVAWSVMAEIWVYISFGLLTYLVRTRTSYQVLLVGLILLFSAALAYSYRDMDMVHGAGPVVRAFAGFYMGALCYQTFINDWSRRFLIGVACTQIALASGFGNYDLVSIPMSALIISFFFDRKAPENPRARRFLSWLGDISYPLYLWHFLMSVVVAKLIGKLFGGTSVIIHDEKFASIPPYYGDLFCLVLMAASLAAAQASIILEKHYRQISGRRRQREHADGP